MKATKLMLIFLFSYQSCSSCSNVMLGHGKNIQQIKKGRACLYNQKEEEKEGGEVLLDLDIEIQGLQLEWGNINRNPRAPPGGGGSWDKAATCPFARMPCCHALKKKKRAESHFYLNFLKYLK